VRGVKAMDVGADANNFTPISLEEVVDLLKDQDECKYLNIPQRD
jgi:calcineurin-like phosphoesterase family protein